MEELEMPNAPGPPEQRPSHSLVSILVISLVCFLFSIGCCYFAIFSLSFRSGLAESAIQHARLQTECLKAIPVRYSVGNTHLFPSKLHDASHSKWTAGLLYLFESQYRAHGIEKGYLSSNDYVEFSGDVYASRVSSHYDLSLSFLNKNFGRVFGGRILGFPKNFIDHFQTSRCESSGIAPEGTSASALKRTCIPLEVTTSNQYSGIRTIKEALWTSGRPMAVSMRIPNKRVIFRDKEYSFPPRSSLLFHESGGEIELGEHIVMAVVGYDDNFVVEGRDGHVYSGGFVLRSGFGDNEHSSDYLFSNLVEDQEQQLCPDIGDASRWRIVSEECLASRSSLVNCNATELVCVNAEFCDVGVTYARINSTTFLNVQDSSYLSLDGFPEEYLIHVFKPVVSRNYQACGYSFLPYDVAQQLEALSRDSFSFLAFDMELSFRDDGYFTHCRSDCTHISAATHTFNSTEKLFPYENPVHFLFL